MGVGTGGDIDIKGRSLSITDGGTINSSTSGRGDAGNVSINVTQALTVAGVNNDSSFLSLISSGVFPEALGRGGDIEITAGSIFVADNGRLTTETQTISGNTKNIDAGNIFLNVNDTLSLTSGGQLRSDTSGQGNAGNITIDAPNAVISLDGASIFNEELIISGIATVIQPIEELASDRTGGDINITAKSLSITNGAELNARTEGVGNAGNVNINVAETIILDDPFSGIFTRVEDGAVGNGGDITINAESLSLSNGAQLATDTLGMGDAGNINLDIRGAIEVRDFATIPIDGVDFPLQTAIASGVAPEAVGNGGDINLKSQSVTLNNFSLITTATLGRGNAGNISLQVDDFVNLSRLSVIESLVGFGAVGEGGDIDLQARFLTLTDASQIETLLVRETNGIPGGQGKAGNIQIETSDFVSISGVSKVQLPVADPTFPSQLLPTEGFSSGLLASAEKGSIGSAGNISITTGTFQIADGAIVNTLTTNADDAGNITINANTFKATGGGQILVTTRNSGNAGDIKLNIADNITLSGKDPNFDTRLAEFGEDIVNNQSAESGIFANTTANSTGQGGNIEIETNSVVLDDRGTIVANSQGEGIAGNLTINATGNINATDGNITTSAERTSGGAIAVTARNIRLEGNSDIRTNVASGTGGGGDITITADSILAFADSDILAFARDGKGGNITLDTPVFFGSRFQPASEGTNPDTLDNNDRVDINASGAVAGAITIPDVSFIQNSLTELPGNLIDTEAIIANSCVVRSQEKEGKFIITGSGGLPVRPGDLSISPYTTGTVRNVPQQESSSDSWQIGDAVVEPQGVYRLGNGQLVLSRECDR
jgi:large exoprotein involved in heme utilization and adhesion